MDRQYTDFFKLISRSMEIIAEKAMEENKEKGDLNGYKTAQKMRDEYARITDSFSSNDTYIPNKVVFASLLVGANLFASNIEKRIKTEQMALASYRSHLIPKLEKVVNAPEKANEIFSIEEKEKEKEN